MNPPGCTGPLIPPVATQRLQRLVEAEAVAVAVQEPELVERERARRAEVLQLLHDALLAGLEHELEARAGLQPAGAQRRLRD